MPGGSCDHYHEPKRFDFDKKKFKKIIKKYFPHLISPKIYFFDDKRDDDIHPAFEILGDFNNSKNRIRIFRMQNRIDFQNEEDAKVDILFTILHELGHWHCCPKHYWYRMNPWRYGIYVYNAFSAILTPLFAYFGYYYLAAIGFVHYTALLIANVKVYKLKFQKVLSRDNEENADAYAAEMLNFPLGMEIASCIKITSLPTLNAAP